MLGTTNTVMDGRRDWDWDLDRGRMRTVRKDDRISIECPLLRSPETGERNTEQSGLELVVVQIEMIVIDIGPGREEDRRSRDGWMDPLLACLVTTTERERRYWQEILGEKQNRNEERENGREVEGKDLRQLENNIDIIIRNQKA